MASNAVIGALRVNLGLDSVEFSAGLKKAQTGLAGFGKAAAVGLTAASVAAVAAGAAFGALAKKAIDSADDLSKTAQKAGLTTEALSRLKHAADFSDVSLEQLSGGLQKLSRNMADVASGAGGSAATALSALGIKVTDATGQLRQADEVFADIAERFAALENGSTKTALAIQIFGRAGADLIPLLNSGRDGLAAMADESDRLGLTVSTKTGRAAEEFNDTLTKVGRIVDGVAMKVAEAALPALQSLADTLASPEVAQAAQTLGTTMVAAFDLVVQAVVGTTNAVKGFLDWLNGMGGATPGNGAPLLNGLLPGEKLNLADRIKANSAVPTTAQELYTGFGFGPGGKMNVSLPKPPQVPKLPTFSSGGGGGSGADALASRLENLRQSLMTEEQLEMDSHAKRLAEIQKFYDSGMILRSEYDSMLLSAQQQHAEEMNEIARRQVEQEARIREQLVGSVANVFGALSSLAESFGDKNLGIAKAFAVAEAIINTAQGITKALAQGGMLGFAGAAAVAASGAAQIATILKTEKGSSSKPSVKGSGSSIGSPAVAAPVGREGTAVNVTLKGGGLYSRDNIGELFDAINSALGDGFKLNLQEQ